MPLSLWPCTSPLGISSPRGGIQKKKRKRGKGVAEIVILIILDII